VSEEYFSRGAESARGKTCIDKSFFNVIILRRAPEPLKSKNRSTLYREDRDKARRHDFIV
jgi:hypothetical protein